MSFEKEDCNSHYLFSRYSLEFLIRQAIISSISRLSPRCQAIEVNSLWRFFEKWIIKRQKFTLWKCYLQSIIPIGVKIRVTHQWLVSYCVIWEIDNLKHKRFWLIKHSLMCNQCDLSRVDWEKLELQSDMFTENLIPLFMRVFSYTLESQRDASSLVSIDLSKEI